KKELTSTSPDESGELKIDMTIWDIMGQKGFRELLKEAYFYGARGILAVCDVTRKKTLDDLDDWIEGVYSVTGKIPIEFLGNKVDLKDQVQISEDDMVQAARASSCSCRMRSTTGTSRPSARKSPRNRSTWSGRALPRRST